MPKEPMLPDGPTFIYSQPYQMCEELVNSWCVLKIRGYGDKLILNYFKDNSKHFSKRHQIHREKCMHRMDRRLGDHEVIEKNSRLAVNQGCIFKHNNCHKYFRYRLEASAKTDTLWQPEYLNIIRLRQMNPLTTIDNTELLKSAKKRFKAIIADLKNGEEKAISIVFAFGMFLKELENDSVDLDKIIGGHAVGFYASREDKGDDFVYNFQCFDPNYGVYHFKRKMICFAPINEYPIILNFLSDNILENILNFYLKDAFDIAGNNYAFPHTLFNVRFRFVSAVRDMTERWSSERKERRKLRGIKI